MCACCSLSVTPNDDMNHFTSCVCESPSLSNGLLLIRCSEKKEKRQSSGEKSRIERCRFSQSVKRVFPVLKDVHGVQHATRGCEFGERASV